MPRRPIDGPGWQHRLAGPASASFREARWHGARAWVAVGGQACPPPLHPDRVRACEPSHDSGALRGDQLLPSEAPGMLLLDEVSTVRPRRRAVAIPLPGQRVVDPLDFRASSQVCYRPASEMRSVSHLCGPDCRMLNGGALRAQRRNADCRKTHGEHGGHDEALHRAWRDVRWSEILASMVTSLSQ
jgi:hypothetical protein